MFTKVQCLLLGSRIVLAIVIVLTSVVYPSHEAESTVSVHHKLYQVTFPDGTRCVAAYGGTLSPVAVSCNWEKTHE